MSVHLCVSMCHVVPMFKHMYKHMSAHMSTGVLQALGVVVVTLLGSGQQRQMVACVPPTPTMPFAQCAPSVRPCPLNSTSSQPLRSVSRRSPTHTVCRAAIRDVEAGMEVRQPTRLAAVPEPRVAAGRGMLLNRLVPRRCAIVTPHARGVDRCDTPCQLLSQP